VRWLPTVVLTAVLLLCGAAFGIALDRIVLTRSSSTTDEATPGVAAARRHLRSGKSGKAGPQPGPAAAEAPPVADVPAVRAEAPQAPPAPPAPAAAANRPAASPAGNRRLAMASPRASVDETRPSLPVAPQGPAPTPQPAVVLAPPPAAAPAPAAAEAPAPPPPTALPPPSPPPSDGLSEERLLAAAVRALRTQNDARSALAALDEYRTRYPEGRLSVEANALRASALLAINQRDQALRVLDDLDLAKVPGSLERQLQRAELRAGAGRQQEAIADFDAVLARAGHGDLAERALWGRAQSRLEGGDRAGAQRDASLYLQHHPRGRFAAPAARMLGGAP
jgi:hypothetical protein